MNPRTNEELRIELAELLGWTRDGTDRGMPLWKSPRGYLSVKLCGLPNYPESLDACHEAEETLIPRQRECFAYLLEGDGGTCPKPDDYIGYIELPADATFSELVHASARQRTEALIKTLKQ